MKRKKCKANNNDFIDAALANDATYYDYLNRLKRIATMMFEWENLPDSMNERFIEYSLYYFGSAAFINTDTYGFINTKCSSSGRLNIYHYPTTLNCYSYDFQEQRLTYTGLEDVTDNNKYAVLVMNNWDMTPTCSAIELFAYRLYLAQRTCDVNISAQRTPVMILTDEKQRLTMQNLYLQYDGNYPFIFGDKNLLDPNSVKSLKTDAPYVVDKVSEYKKEIMNEALTFLGINNVMIDKKERLVSDEANSNNEYINLNLQSMLIPRQEAAKKFNKLFNIPKEKEIKVRVRSDLHNIIKQEQSSIMKGSAEYE